MSFSKPPGHVSISVPPATVLSPIEEDENEYETEAEGWEEIADATPHTEDSKQLKQITDDYKQYVENLEEVPDDQLDEQELRKIRLKEERQKRRERRVSPQNTEGAIPKETLRTLSNKTLRHLILHARKEIERYETENYLYEKTIEKLERPEKAIEAELQLAEKEDLGLEMKSAPQQICPSDSETEAEDNGEYVPVIPINEIEVSKDSFFDNMSDNSKDAAIDYFKNIGEIAPSNYDVMRHKYGNMVKGSEEDPAYSYAATKTTRLQTKVFESAILLEQKNAATAAATPAKPTAFKAALGLDDEDPEYPGFSIADAKELPLEDKLKFALEEEEDFRRQFYKHETHALREEGAVQVHIDAHKHSIRLLLTLRKDFRAIMKEARHPITGKLMAEMILRFKRKMRNTISAEETKTRMAIRKIMTIKKKAIHQLKTNKESGNAISQIDFEHLMVENQIFMDEMDEMNLSLKYLKQLSGHFFQILKEDQESIGRLSTEDSRLSKEIEIKENVIKSFEKTYLKYRNMVNDTNTRMDELKRKLSQYHAPKPLEYIRLKECQYEMESDVANLQRKLDEINLSLITARSTFSIYSKMLPDGDQTEIENETWLDDVKAEVERDNLMELLDDESADEDDLPAIFRKPVKPARRRTGRPDSDPSSEETRSKTAPGKGNARAAQTLLTERKFRKKSMKTIYDTDFEFELSSSVAIPEDPNDL